MNKVHQLGLVAFLLCCVLVVNTSAIKQYRNAQVALELGGELFNGTNSPRSRTTFYPVDDVSGATITYQSLSIGTNGLNAYLANSSTSITATTDVDFPVRSMTVTMTFRCQDGWITKDSLKAKLKRDTAADVLIYDSGGQGGITIDTAYYPYDNVRNIITVTQFATEAANAPTYMDGNARSAAPVNPFVYTHRGDSITPGEPGDSGTFNSFTNLSTKTTWTFTFENNNGPAAYLEGVSINFTGEPSGVTVAGRSIDLRSRFTSERNPLITVNGTTTFAQRRNDSER